MWILSIMTMHKHARQMVLADYHAQANESRMATAFNLYCDYCDTVPYPQFNLERYV